MQIGSYNQMHILILSTNFIKISSVSSYDTLLFHEERLNCTYKYNIEAVSFNTDFTLINALTLDAEISASIHCRILCYESKHGQINV